MASRSFCCRARMPPMVAVLALALGTSLRAEDSTIRFNRDIRPILSDACFRCHGPDKANRKAGLRLDTPEGALVDLDGRRAVVAGDPAHSELYRRITAADEDERMPPASTGRKLTANEIETLRCWIEQGARWEKHWSLNPPERPPLPAVRHAAWARNPIDAFVLARLEREGLEPSPEADRLRLIRRVTLDLTGLAPTLAEVDAFLADDSPDAYERVVDRLLASPHYGERLAMPWLDAARYADTNGYQSDGERTMWRWRDWVIDALNRNMPFDQFTIEQIAGDMLPNATIDQRIATGFHRNHRGNAEGGIVPEEYAAEYVADRVETTAIVWLGLTLGCARCHDHKYDPFEQKEFYRLFAFFNNVPEKGKAVKYGNSPPMIEAPTRDQQDELHGIDVRVREAERRLAELEPRIAAAQAAWQASLDPSQPLDWSVARGLVVHLALASAAPDAPSSCPTDAAKTENVASRGVFRDGDPAFVPGPLGPAADLDGTRYVDAGDVANFGYYDKFSCGAWVKLRGTGGAILSRMTDTSASDGYNLHVEAGRVQVNLVKRWLDDAIRVETEQPLEPGRWYHVLMTYDGSRIAAGIRVYVNGQPQKLVVHLDELNQSFETGEPLRIGARGSDGRLDGSIADVRVYRRVLEPDEAALLASADAVSSIAALPPERRTATQAAKMRACFLATRAPAPARNAVQDLLDAQASRERLIASFPGTMVMQELPTPRATHVLLRGQYDRPGERVTPGVPGILNPMPPGAPSDRVGLARWLVDPSNPLTARVQVNRYWQAYFGTGLVRTVEDFGAQGDPPSHPELLDWLACEFMHSCSSRRGAHEAAAGAWDIKHVQHLIVTSATYRQSSRLTRALLQRDPENRLLARAPRLRLSAEIVRDQALAASGLLVQTVGGPSVRPYQPAGLWKELTGAEDYKQGHGEDLYRRSMYTFWKRTVPPPTMITFDASSRETCRVRETRTNTPLQALILMNDVAFVEASRALAERVMKEAGPAPEDRIAHAFRLVTARGPSAGELGVLRGDFAQHLAQYRAHAEQALELVRIGESPRDPALDVAELAAYTAVANLILNLDETVTRE